MFTRIQGLGGDPEDTPCLSVAHGIDSEAKLPRENPSLASWFEDLRLLLPVLQAPFSHLAYEGTNSSHIKLIQGMKGQYPDRMPRTQALS